MSLLEYVEDNNTPDTTVLQRVKKSAPKPKISKPKSVKLKINKPKSVKPKISKPKTHKSKTPEPKIGRSDIDRKPSMLWYLLHVPFGFASGPLCHYLWEDANTAEAEKHLGHGIMISAGTWIATGVTLLVSFV